MGKDVLRIYPPPTESRPLTGLYLAHDLRGQGQPDRPLVYTNFVASLDGRISQVDPASGLRRVPPAIANLRDWRLYMELAAQADVVLTTSRHMRAVAEGRHRDLLAVGEGRYADLAEWRIRRGLPAKPVVAVLSEGLDLPVEQLTTTYDGPLLAVTSEQAREDGIGRLRDAGMDVLVAGRGPGLGGRAIVEALREGGHRLLYSIGGPRVFRTLVEDDSLHRLYLTLVHMLIGGQPFDGLTPESPPLDPPRGFRLLEAHLDTTTPTGVGQTFLCFERERRS